MIFEYSLKTQRECFSDITGEIKNAIQKSGIQSGLCIVFCSHTTAGITINENADPDVIRDMLAGLDKAFPDRPEFRHAEGNSPAHLKASCVGTSVNIIIENGKPLLGTWQGIYFCEFDGPRKRKYYVKIL